MTDLTTGRYDDDEMLAHFDAADAAFYGANPDFGPLAGVAEPKSSARRLPTIDISAWLNLDPPKREWYVTDWIPARQTTLLTGNGGVGKSLLAQQLCTCVALGLPFMGQEVKQSPALYLTVEDDADELWRRQAAICAGLGVPLSAVIGKLHLVSLMGEPGAELAMFDENKRVLPTDRWREVDDTSLHDGIAFIVLDNATDLMAGDLNEVHEVAAFVNLLTGLALRRDGAVILLHHPNKKGDDFAGSQAWHNKVRSRLIMTRDEVDLDARKLMNPKANYAALGGEISFRWIDGAFLTERDIGPDRQRQYEESARAGADNTIFLACLAERNKQERAVSECPGPNYAPAQFEAMPESKGIGRKRLVAAMDRLYRVGRIKRAFLRRDSAKGRDIEGLCEVSFQSPPNAPPNAPQPLSPNAPIMTPKLPQPHTPPLQGGTGAASAAAPYLERQCNPALSTGMILAAGEGRDDAEL